LRLLEPRIKADIKATDDIVDWLSPLVFSKTQHDQIAQRQEGTGKWFLESPKFQSWQLGSDKTLFCPGIPGAGKTIMAATVIDHLLRAARHDIGITYLFCEYKAQSDQSTANLFAALLKLLVQTRLGIPTSVRQIYEDHMKQRTRPSLDEILQALQSVCLNYTTVYVIVDALDECSNHNLARDQLITGLRELQAKVDLRLLFTSRPILGITQQFQLDPVLEVRATEEDVRRYVLAQMPRLPKCIHRDEDLKSILQTKISDAVDGM